MFFLAWNFETSFCIKQCPANRKRLLRMFVHFCCWIAGLIFYFPKPCCIGEELTPFLAQQFHKTYCPLFSFLRSSPSATFKPLCPLLYSRIHLAKRRWTRNHGTRALESQIWTRPHLLIIPHKLVLTWGFVNTITTDVMKRFHRLKLNVFHNPFLKARQGLAYQFTNAYAERRL